MTETDVYEYLILFHVRGGESYDEIVWATDVEKAIRNLREKIRRDYVPADPRRQVGIVIDSAAKETS